MIGNVGGKIDMTRRFGIKLVESKFMEGNTNGMAAYKTLLWCERTLTKIGATGILVERGP